MGSRASRLIFILFFLLVGGWTVIYRPPQLKEGPEESDLAAFERRGDFTDSWRRFHRARLLEERADNISREEIDRTADKYESAAGYYRSFVDEKREDIDAISRESFLQYVSGRSLARVEEKITAMENE